MEKCKLCDNILECKNYFNSSTKIQALEKENNAFKEYIKNKSDIIKSYDEYKKSNLAIMIDADEKLSQEFDDIFNSYKIFRDNENKLLAEKLEKAKKCVEFYAKGGNWDSRIFCDGDDDYENYDIITIDDVTLASKNDCDATEFDGCGGKLARQTLKEIEGVK